MPDAYWRLAGDAECGGPNASSAPELDVFDWLTAGLQCADIARANW
jgi:hypothetical protein